MQRGFSEDAKNLCNGKQHEPERELLGQLCDWEFFCSLKTERLFFTNYKTRDEARKDLVDYIEMFYNNRRRHSYLGYVSPREFEEMRLLDKAA